MKMKMHKKVQNSKLLELLDYRGNNGECFMKTLQQQVPQSKESMDEEDISKFHQCVQVLYQQETSYFKFYLLGSMPDWLVDPVLDDVDFQERLNGYTSKRLSTFFVFQQVAVSVLSISMLYLFYDKVINESGDISFVVECCLWIVWSHAFIHEVIQIRAALFQGHLKHYSTFWNALDIAMLIILPCVLLLVDRDAGYTDANAALLTSANILLWAQLLDDLRVMNYYLNLFMDGLVKVKSILLLLVHISEYIFWLQC